jgi:hypothetical protein
MHESHPASRPHPNCPSSESDTPAAIPQNSPGFPIPEKIADQPAQLHPAAPELSQKQLAALNRLFAGEHDAFICHALKIDRKTLYNKIKSYQP